MLIVSDNSPLNLLILLNLADLLPKLFAQVFIPPEVAQEMRHSRTPLAVQTFISAPPSWLQIQTPTTHLHLPELDPGEVAAISLAVELCAPIMIDETDGRKAAAAYGLQIVGAVGILERAANQNLIPDLKHVHNQIRSLRFHITNTVLDASLARHLQYKSHPA